MKAKELRKLAQQMANLELIIERSDDTEEVRKAQNEIIHLSGKLDPEDMFEIDELIQNILEKNT
jgi:hypothetical protein